jgi:hypothetical protein
MFFHHSFCTIPSVLGYILKLVITAFSTTSHLVFMSNICLAIQFRSFDHDVEGEGALISLYICQFLPNIGVPRLV